MDSIKEMKVHAVECQMEPACPEAAWAHMYALAASLANSPSCHWCQQQGRTTEPLNGRITRRLNPQSSPRPPHRILPCNPYSLFPCCLDLHCSQTAGKLNQVMIQKSMASSTWLHSQDCFCSFGMVICDESHALKTHSAKRTQFIWPLVQQAKRAILITGTPALSRPIELFPQVQLRDCPPQVTTRC